MLPVMFTMKQKSNNTEFSESDQQIRQSNLLNQPLQVVNIGLENSRDDLVGQGIKVVQVDWTPPARGNAHLANLLSRLTD